MKFNEEKFKSLREKVTWLLQKNDINQFDKLLNEELHPIYLFEDHYHSTQVDYRNYSSLFTQICDSGNLGFVKSAIEKSSLLNDETNYLISTATASGFIRACEGGYLDIVKYLAQVDKKYRDIIGEDYGINLRIASNEFGGRTELIHYVLDCAIINALYKNENKENLKKPNMELVEYLFLSDELDNHPKIHFHHLITIFMNNDLNLFDKVLPKALNNGVDIHDIFGKSWFDFSNRETVLVDMAKHLIHKAKIYTYPKMEEKIIKEPILNTVYLAEQLNSDLSNNNGQVKNRVKL